MTTAPACGIIVSEYIFMHHLPRVCRTLVPKICVHLEMLHVVQYYEVLMCVYNCTRH